MPGWSQLGEGVRAQVAERRAGQLAALAQQAVALEAAMKSNHRWTNRTGKAEEGLFATVAQDGLVMTLTAGSRGEPEKNGGPHHGLYLQVSHFMGWHPRGRRFNPTLPMSWDTVTPPTPYANVHETLVAALPGILGAVNTP